MRRGLLLSLTLGLLGLAAGCQHHCHGVCDCQVYPIDHGTPCPWSKPAGASAGPIHPVADTGAPAVAP